MRRLALHALSGIAVIALGCGPEELPVEALATCDGIEVQPLEQGVEAPARVWARVRVSGCGGRHVKAPITSASFVLSEDGEALSSHESKWSISAAERSVQSMTLVALDLSGSVSGSGLKRQMVDGARRLVARLVPSHQVAIFGFDGRPELVPYVYFTDDYDALMTALDRVLDEDVVDESTNLHGAVVEGLSILDEAVTTAGADEQRIAHGTMVLFTDGEDRAGRMPAAEAYSATANTPHATYAIGLSATVPVDVLNNLGRTARQVAIDGEDVVAAFDRTATDLRQRARRDFDIGYCSPKRSGRHVLRIAVAQDNLRGAIAIPFDAEGFGGGCTP